MTDDKADRPRRKARARRTRRTATEAVLDALWGRVLEAWDDDKPHHALLEYAIREQKLPDVAGRYRAIKEKDAEKAARAQKKLDGIVIAATQMLMAMKSPPDRYKVPPSVIVVVFVVSLLFLWLAYAVFTGADPPPRGARYGRADENACAPWASPYPATRRVEQKDVLFGTEVRDPYRWLEDASASGGPGVDEGSGRFDAREARRPAGARARSPRG